MYIFKLSTKSISSSLFSIFLILALSIKCESVIPAKHIALNPLFSDNMVLQQKQDIPIWGTGEPGGEVIVSLNKQQKKAIVDKDGKWSTKLAPVEAGGPYQLIISGESTHQINNVMVGEVWICSGQSNMEMAVSASWGHVNNHQEEVNNANYPNIRLLMVDKEMAITPQENFTSEGWKECSPETIPGFSAVAYFFGRRLSKDLNVPIGLIQTAWGGTVVETWTSAKSLKNINEFEYEIDALNSGVFKEKMQAKPFSKEQLRWVNEVQKSLKKAGILNRDYIKSGYNTKNWKSLEVPKVWEDQNIKFDGVMWVKKEINIPDSWKGKELTLNFEAINDYDITYFNGKQVGSNPNANMPRNYIIPKDLVKTGKNEITVMILDIGNNGGIFGNPEKAIIGYSDTEKISLAGKWKYKKDKFDLKTISHPPVWDLAVAQNRPTVLYNAMINPIVPYGIRGAIWYQGESNASRAMQYRELFKALINDWREVWQQGDFPFYFVQIANFLKIYDQPVDENWSYLREAQNMALELPNTGVAVTIDIGDDKDIHPKNKQDVGKRLALNALAKTYKKDIAYSGPIYKSMKIDGNKIHLQFTNTNKGLKIKGEQILKGFAIAGADKKFVWAEAKIEGDEIIVHHSKIKNPVAVRYAWASNPVCNLYNGADLPASPFRTDDWQKN